MPELKVGLECVPWRDGDNPTVVNGDLLEDEAENLVPLRGIRLLTPEPGEVGQRGSRIADVGQHRRLERRELGLKDALVSFVLLACEVTEEIEIFRPRELTFDRPS